MILIYNISGLLFGVLGLFLGGGVASTLVSIGSPVWLCPGALTVAGIWCKFGKAKLNAETGEKTPAPAIFFIPLFYWGLLLAVLAVPVGFFEITAGPRQQFAPGVGGGGGGAPGSGDLRQQQFDDVERGLSRNVSDDEVLSGLLTVMIAKVLPGESVNVSIKSSEGRVLVLMKLKDLKKIKDPDRKLLLKSIRELAESHRPGVKVYAGIKGKMLFGAITIPEQPDLVSTAVDEKKLLAFFDQPAKADDNKAVAAESTANDGGNAPSDSNANQPKEPTESTPSSSNPADDQKQN